MIPLPVANILKKTESFPDSTPARSHQLWRVSHQPPYHNFKSSCQRPPIKAVPFCLGGVGKETLSQKPSLFLILNWGVSAVINATTKRVPLPFMDFHMVSGDIMDQ